MLSQSIQPDNQKTQPPRHPGIIHRGRSTRTNTDLLFDLVVKATNSIIWEADADDGDRRFRELGPRALEILGYTGRQWRELGFWESHVHPDDLSRTLAEYERGVTTVETFELSYRMIARDGRIVRVRDVIRVVRATAGKPGLVFGLITDFREQYTGDSGGVPFHWLLDNVCEGLCYFAGAADGSYRLRYANTAMTEMLALSSHEIIGRRLEEVLDAPRFIPLREKLRTSMSSDSDLSWTQQLTIGSEAHRFTFKTARFSAVCPRTGFLLGCVREITPSEAENTGGAQTIIEALEEERRRIARELHDDLSQKMALLAIDLDRLYESNADPHEARARILKAVERSQEISVDISRISHQLHSTRIADLGLMKAVTGLCDEFSKQTNLRIRFSHFNVPRSIPGDISVCLLRVAQESLRNVQKHGCARNVSVTLFGDVDALTLCVVDDGTGFDPEKAMTGLGLVSMRERARIAGGTFAVHSRLSIGTQISLRVPLPKPGRFGTPSGSSLLGRNAIDIEETK